MEKTLIDCMSEIKDYRGGNGIEHKLIDIHVIAVLAVLCGADEWTEMEEFGEEQMSLG